MGRVKLNSGESTQKPKRRKQDNLAPAWQPGQSGNPNGRPMGSRQILSEKLLKELQVYFDKEGPDLIQRVAIEQPAALLQAMCKLLPRDMTLEISTVNIDLTPDQRRRIAENWILSNTVDDRVDALECEAVRIESKAALPAVVADEPEEVPGREDGRMEGKAVRLENDESSFHDPAVVTKRPYHKQRAFK